MVSQSSSSNKVVLRVVLRVVLIRRLLKTKSMQKTKQALVLVGALLLASGALSQVSVVESTAVPVANASQARVQRAAQGELFYQLQLLQDEMMQLRGILEEQQHVIRQLKQQRLDDYLNLDRRISELTVGSPVQASPGRAPSPSGKSTATSAGKQTSSAASSDEESAYRAAYGLVKTQQFIGAKEAFEKFVSSYPTGNYVPNAHYWLGELYLLEPNLEAARQSFTQLLDQYPSHRKVPDAMFKLAKVYHLLGNGAKARSLLDQVIKNHGSSSSSAVKLAKDYLQKNF